MRRSLGWTVACIGLVVLGGCTKPANSGGAGVGGSAEAGGSLSLKGSDTMVQLAQAWAQDFMGEHPEIKVTVTGGGSNTGIAALMNKGADLANASRPIKDEEKERASKSGVEVKEIVVARDALAIVVNPDNPIDELTLEQLKAIYQEKVKDWSELGGSPGRIVVNSRESSSGTYSFFQEHVLMNEPFATGILYQPATSQIVTGVAQDKGAIGYVGLGYLSDQIKTIKVKIDAGSPGVEPTVANVLNDSYPLSRPLFEYTNGEPTGNAKVWFDWILGPKGQAIVEKLGFVPVKG